MQQVFQEHERQRLSMFNTCDNSAQVIWNLKKNRVVRGDIYSCEILMFVFNIFFSFSSDPYSDFKSKNDIPYVLYGWYKCICMADNAEETKL